ncbi:N-6 DNA methylase [Nocardia farcinica]|uniref:N-6 DNA methylase n=1 Tax=Nocardia farcinica TaxID=37329 RepID=UPI001895FD77|nr:N-6 DNA methylase [Nocardia farcinica]MBF6520692.1 N-6 DNA methylase [Nocardia farcinica]
MSEVSAAEIARLAGVTRATVSNWRRRHHDFPPATAGTDARPLFDLEQVQAWLAEHGVEVPDSPATVLRTLVRACAPRRVRAVMHALHRGAEGWEVADGAVDESDLAVRIAQALTLTAERDGTRAAVDIVAERALEDMAVTGLYPTPEPVAALMARLAVSENAGADVLDPACGSGSLLLAAADVGAAALCGQDISPVQVDRARLVLEADTLRQPDLRTGDSLRSDAFADRRFDAVLCNPPYGQRDWGSGELALDIRWDYGLPPRGEPELAWVQHAIAHLHPGAYAVLLLPPAVASRAPGRRVRASLVRAGALRAVIGLPPGAAQPWHIGLQIWVVRRPAPGAVVQDSLLFVDTTAMRSATRPERIDWKQLSDEVIRTWRSLDDAVPGPADPSGIAAVVRSVDALDDEVDLNPARYVRSSLDAAAVADRARAAMDRLGAAASQLTSLVDGITDWSEAAATWRFVTVADLVAHGQLEWIRARPGSSERAERGDTRRVLTAPDVAKGEPASETMASVAPSEVVEVCAGDVLVPAVRSDRGGRTARVAGPGDAGTVLGPHVHALRLDTDQLDPWFVAGFLTGGENVSATRTSTVRFDPSRLRIPVLSLPEQRLYGAIFRQLFLVRTTAGAVFTAAEHVADLMTTGLTAGALAPVVTGPRP